MTRTRSNWMTAFAVAAAALGFGASQAMASTTTVQPPAAGEDSHEQIFENVYGGDFVQAGNDFTNGTITATRIDDDNDQIWNLTKAVNTHARAVFASLNQTFGYIPGADGTLGDFVKLFDVTGTGTNGYTVGGQAQVELTGDFKWARQGSNGTASSENADNPDSIDHLVSYEISGIDAPKPIFMLFFEDLYQNNGEYDADYNDLVVEVASVPTPGAFGAGLALLGVAGLVRRRRRRVA